MSVIFVGPLCRPGDPLPVPPLLAEAGEADRELPKVCDDSRLTETSAATFDGMADNGVEAEAGLTDASPDPDPEFVVFAEDGTDENKLKTRLAASTSSCVGSNPGAWS